LLLSAAALACSGNPRPSAVYPAGQRGIAEAIASLGIDTLCTGTCGAIVVDSLVRAPSRLTAAHPLNAPVAFLITPSDIAAVRWWTSLHRGRYGPPWVAGDTLVLAFQMNMERPVVEGASREYGVTIHAPGRSTEMILVSLKANEERTWSVMGMRPLVEW
jgi:hypothetical protein